MKHRYVPLPTTMFASNVMWEKNLGLGQISSDLLPHDSWKTTLSLVFCRFREQRSKVHQNGVQQNQMVLEVTQLASVCIIFHMKNMLQLLGHGTLLTGYIIKTRKSLIVSDWSKIKDRVMCTVIQTTFCN